MKLQVLDELAIALLCRREHRAPFRAARQANADPGPETGLGIDIDGAVMEVDGA